MFLLLIRITGECGAENWAGISGDTLASVNVPLFEAKNVDYILSTGGAAGFPLILVLCNLF